jgi:hypothetical protein
MIQSIHELTYSFTAWLSLALAVVLLHCKSQYKQRLLFLCLCSSADTPCQPAVNPTSGSVIGRPARNQPTEAEPTLLHRGQTKAELAFYLQFVLPRYGVGQISNVVILNSALESEKV